MVIDLKSFYAACECADRGLDMFKTNLVVCDIERSKGSITLAVTPALKKLGVPSRTRAFDLPKNVNIIYAKPRMSRYIEYSTLVFECYLNFFSHEDIYVYSIDECFIDLTPYKSLYENPYKLALEIQEFVYKRLKLVVTAGIGTNMFLAKVALDILSKHSPDNIGYLDTALFKEKIWPITDLESIWSIGPGIKRRLNKLGIFSVEEIAFTPKEILKKEFGVIGLELYDHAWGVDDTKLFECKNMITKSRSISQGQVLFKDYRKEDAIVVLSEMVDILCFSLSVEGFLTKSLSLYIGYTKNLGGISKSFRLNSYTNSFKEINDSFKFIYNKYVADLPIRRISICATNLLDKAPNQLSLFDETKDDNSLYEQIALIKAKYGKNSLIRAISLDKNGTQRERNTYIGGHHE